MRWLLPTHFAKDKIPWQDLIGLFGNLCLADVIFKNWVNGFRHFLKVRRGNNG
jgi:hypothetical protein